MCDNLDITEPLKSSSESHNAQCIGCDEKWLFHQFRDWSALKTAFQAHIRATGHPVIVYRTCIVERADG